MALMRPFAQLLLAAIEPAQLTIALEAIEHLERNPRDDHQWHLRIERRAMRRSGLGGAMRQWSRNFA